MIDSQHGARVFVDAHEAATLLAYRRLHTSYLVVVYTRRAAWYGLASFSDLLDTLPVRSVPLAGAQLPLDATVERTLDAWRADLARALARSLSFFAAV